MLGARLPGCTGGHVDGSLSVIVDKNLRNGARGAIQKNVVVDSRALHLLSQEATSLVVPLSSRQTHFKTKESSPAHLIEKNAPDVIPDGPLSLDGVHHSLLISPKNTRNTVHTVQRHTSDSDNIELAL